ncbi:MAG: FAD-dependent oxidoreductase [Candidatus Micrarchaeota archaeon]|nr:FAD-dependent oxidoreductase [Candidatus Micrarchaeota archaeon]
MKIGILGGGLSGLTLGFHLKKDFEILEKNSECGGLCRSLTEEGFTFDYGGSHVIFTKDKDVFNLYRKLLHGNWVKRKRNSKILFKGRYIKYPFENGLYQLPKQDNYECISSFIKNLIEVSKGKVKKPTNFQEWMYYTFGKGITEKYLIPYNRKIWNYPPGKLSLELLASGIPMPPAEDIIKSSLGIKTEGYHQNLIFYYPIQGGINALVKPMEEKLRDKITYNFEVKSVAREGGKFTVSDGKEERKYDKLVSCMPIPDLIDSMDGVPKDVKEAKNNLKYNSLITVMVGIDEPRINNISWMYIPAEEDGDFNRLSFPFNFSRYVAPEGKSSVLVEITCLPNDPLLKQSDDKILKQVVKDLERLGFARNSKISYRNVRRSEYAYVIYDLDYNKNSSKVFKFLKKRRIESCGRFAEFKYMNMAACIRSAMNKAKEINST